MVFSIVLKLNSAKRHKTKVNTCLRKDDITRHIERTQCGLQSENWLGKKPGRYSELQHVLLMAVGGSTLHTTSCVRHAGEQICGGSFVEGKKAISKRSFSPLLHKAFSFSGSSICKHSKRFSVHRA